MDGDGRAKDSIPTEERFASLVGVATKLGAIRQPEEIIRRLAQELRGLLVFDYLSLYLEGALGEGPSWHVLDVACQSIPTPVREPPIEGPIGSWVLEHQVPYLLHQKECDPCVTGFEDEAARRGLASMAAIPLTTVRRRLGALVVASRSPAAYGKSEMLFLSHVGSFVALAIDDAVSFERLRMAQEELARSNEGLRLVLDVGRRLLSNLEMEALLRSIASTVRASLQCEAAAIILVDKELTQGRVFVLDFPESRGVTPEGTSIPIAGTAIEEILRVGGPCDLRSLPPDEPALCSLRAEGLAGGYSFPLVGRNRVLGVFAVAMREEGGFDAHRLELLEQRLRLEAKTIRTKYISPPDTTDFALMFLPTEGLYAEAVRRPGLMDDLQRTWRVVVAGPSTLAAILSSLQMGFRTLAVEKRSSEVWQLLGAVKTEFGKFGDVLAKTKEQIDRASTTLGTAAVRTRAIERKLRDVESLPDTSSAQLLEDDTGAAP